VNGFKSLIRTIEVATAVLLGLCIGAVFVNALLRYGFDSGLVFTEEMSRIAVVWIVFLGAIAALHGRHHVGMTMAVERFPRRLRRLTALTVGLLMLACDVLLVVGAWKQMMLSLNDSYPVTGLPSAAIYVPGIVAGGMFALITAGRLMMVLLGRLPYDELFCAAPQDAEALESGAG